MKMVIYIKLFAVILFSAGSPGLKVKAGEPDIEKLARIEGGLVLGGQIISDVLIYTPGGNFNYIYSLKAGTNSCFGFGVGFTYLGEESFIPLYFDFLGFTGRGKNSFINFQAGYSFGFSDLYKNYEHYDFNGGVCFKIGLGRIFSINDRFSVYTSVAYKHQFAAVTYSYGQRDIRNDLNYDMIVFSLGFMLRQK